MHSLAPFSLMRPCSHIQIHIFGFSTSERVGEALRSWSRFHARRKRRNFLPSRRFSRNVNVCSYMLSTNGQKQGTVYQVMMPAFSRYPS